MGRNAKAIHAARTNASISPRENYAFNQIRKLDMALSFAPQFHTEVQPGSWTRVVNPLTPFGAHPSMDIERKAFQEADRIESEGDRIVIMETKH